MDTLWGVGLIMAYKIIAFIQHDKAFFVIICQIYVLFLVLFVNFTRTSITTKAYVTSQTNIEKSHIFVSNDSYWVYLFICATCFVLALIYSGHAGQLLFGPLYIYENAFNASPQRALPPVLITLRCSADVLEEYKTEYGYLGPLLHSAVIQARQTDTKSTAATYTKPTSTLSQVFNDLFLYFLVLKVAYQPKRQPC